MSDSDDIQTKTKILKELWKSKKETKEVTIGGCIGSLIHFLFFFMVIIPARIIYQGYILTKMWAWFIIPTFQVEALPLLTASGFFVMVSLLTFSNKPRGNEIKGMGHMWAGLATAVIATTMIWNIGYVLHLVLG